MLGLLFLTIWVHGFVLVLPVNKISQNAPAGFRQSLVVNCWAPPAAQKGKAK